MGQMPRTNEGDANSYYKARLQGLDNPPSKGDHRRPLSLELALKLNPRNSDLTRLAPSLKSFSKR